MHCTRGRLSSSKTNATFPEISTELFSPKLQEKHRKMRPTHATYMAILWPSLFQLQLYGNLWPPLFQLLLVAIKLTEAFRITVATVSYLV